MSTSQLSHVQGYVSKEDFEQHLEALKSQKNYEKKEALESLIQDATLVDQVKGSAFWRHYFVNGGLGGQFTEYFACFTPRMEKDLWNEPIPEIDRDYLTGHHLPRSYQETVALTKGLIAERVQYLQSESDERQITIASLACGTMYDVLRVDYKKSNVQFVGYDSDPLSIEHAREKAKQLGLSDRLITHEKEILEDDLTENACDIVVCNGFSFYISDDKALQGLIRKVERVLKPGGMFIMSFILPTDQWKVSQEEMEAHTKVQKIFDAVVSKWTAKFRTSGDLKKYFSKAGFVSNKIIEESHQIHPLIVGYKSEN